MHIAKQTFDMQKDNETKKARTTVSVWQDCMRDAQIAATLLDESITDFVSTAVRERAESTLKEQKVKLPVSRAA